MAYFIPSPTTSLFFVNSPRKDFIPIRHTIMIIIPCTSPSSTPQEAAWSALFFSFAPSRYAISTFTPTPNPTDTAVRTSCTGYTRESAVIASSLTLATKKLSTILNNEFTSIDKTIGSDIDKTSGSIFFSFINVWSIFFLPHKKDYRSTVLFSETVKSIVPFKARTG